MPNRPSAIACILVALALTGCSVGRSSTPTTPAPSAPSTAVSLTATTVPVDVPEPTQPTKWLCLPSMKSNPCEGGLDATIVAANGSTSVEPFTPTSNPIVDCFYVYPTVSAAPTPNAPLESSPEIVAVARAQAARFAQVCRLYVPLYRQGTVAALAAGHASDPNLAYNDVLSSWHDYLLHYNRGRGVVLIGHSQGATVLRRLLQTDIETRAAVRALLVSAVLPGTNFSVPPGADVGGDLHQIPACRREDQTGCVLSWSTYDATPPTRALFGRVGGGRRVLCTNPAALGGGAASLHPYFPTSRLVSKGLTGAAVPGTFSTGFVAYRGAVTGTCEHLAGADFLLVRGRLDGRDVSTFDRLGPTWGLHVVDVNIALGDLLNVVAKQAAAFAHR